MTEQVRFRDFTKKRSPVSFRVGEFEFECYKALSPAKLQDAILTWRTKEDGTAGEMEINEKNFVKRIAEVFKFFLLPASYAVFIEVLNDEDNDDPIDMEQYSEIIQWLMEMYGARPTQASSDSSSSSETDDAGTSSAAGVQLQELTLFDSTAQGSSTS